MAGTVCSKCNVGWVIHPHDKHCGYCGCQVFDFSVKWKEEPWIYAGDGANIHDLTILVENTGAYPITFHQIRTSRDNTIQFLDANDKPFEVKAGKFRAFQIQVNLANLARFVETITVRAKDAPPGLKSEKSLRLEALPLPEFKLIPDPINVKHRRGTETVTGELHLEVLQSQFYISDIKVTGGSILRVGYSKQLHQKDGASKKVILKIDCNRLTNEPNEVKLNFEIRGLSQPIEKRIEIRGEIVPEPPKLFVPLMSLDVTQNRRKTHTLTLQNRGERPLTIQDIIFNNPSHLVQLPNLEFPIKIEGGKHQNIELQVSAEGIEPETYPINFNINSNCEEVSKYEGVLNVKVNKLEEYPHYLAIDFGTTNSCCAYIDLDTYKPKLIPLDTKANPPEIMPSTIVYHSNPTNGKTHHVGYDAENFRTSEIDGPYYIASVKRWLGYEWGRDFPDNQNIQPSDVVADILKHIIKQAEDYLDILAMPSKVTRCAVSHPTMFVTEQQEDLKLAFEKIGITDIIFIDEASAASMGTISQYLKKHDAFPNDYSMLVYDFGGGTIDIVLSEVKGKNNEYAIEPIARGGNLKYGGDDVTQAIVDFVLAECRQRIQNTSGNLRFKIPYLRMRKILKPSGNPEIDKASRENSAVLYRVAEEMKRELSEKTETEKRFQLNIVIENNVRSLESLIGNDISVELSEERLQALIEPILNETFTNIDAMISENCGRPPKTVVLAGQSSKMPLLERMMAAYLQERYNKPISINRVEDLKACVVIGAAQYGLTKSLPGVKFQIKLVDKTHSRLGIVRQSVINTIFEEIIPSGKLIPKESSGTTDFPLSSKMVTIAVHEHFGKDNDLENTSQIGSYTLTLPDAISEQALGEARLKMSVNENSDIQVIVIVDGEEYKSTVKKIKPAFVSEI